MDAGFFGPDEVVVGSRGNKKPWSLDVATLVWQKWSVEAISRQLNVPVAQLEREYADELANGARIIEGRVACQLVKKALGNDDKSLHLLAKSKFGFVEPPREAVGAVVNVGVGVNLSPEGENALVSAVRGLEERGAVMLGEAASAPPKAAKAVRKPAPKGVNSSPKQAKEVDEQQADRGVLGSLPLGLLESLTHNI